MLPTRGITLTLVVPFQLTRDDCDWQLWLAQQDPIIARIPKPLP